MRFKLLFAFNLFIACFPLSAVEVEGKLGWADRQQYGFAVTGVVSERVVQAGDKVEKGDLLARLDLRPFNYKISGCSARVKKWEPLVYDAKLDLDHAEELFERTVLSEVELQRIDSKYKALVAEKDMFEAECKLEKWKAEKATLKAKEQSYVINSSFVPGMIISNENKATVFMELVSANKATATSWLTAQQKSQLKLAKEIEVVFEHQSIPAKVQSIDLQANEANLHRVVFVFYFRQSIEPGKVLKVGF